MITSGLPVYSFDPSSKVRSEIKGPFSLVGTFSERFASSHTHTPTRTYSRPCPKHGDRSECQEEVGPLDLPGRFSDPHSLSSEFNLQTKREDQAYSFRANSGVWFENP